MEEMVNLLSSVVPLEVAAKQEIIKSSKEKKYKGGQYILRSGQVCRHFYFIKSGLAKLYFQKGEKEFIMNFFNENIIFTELTSYLTDKLSTSNIVAIEDTHLIMIEKTEIINLCKRFHCIEALFSKIFSLGTLRMQKRISELLEENATMRYRNFVNDRTDVFYRLSLGDVANYLGITQVTLSRIRAEK